MFDVYVLKFSPSSLKNDGPRFGIQAESPKGAEWLAKRCTHFGYCQGHFMSPEQIRKVLESSVEDGIITINSELL